MKKIIVLSVISFFVCTLRADAVPYNLYWDLGKGDRLELVKTASAKFYLNTKLRRSYLERNIIDLTCYDKSEKTLNVKGAFSVFSRNDDESVFKLEKRLYADFTIRRNGEYEVSREYLMPNLRHIPTFPGKELSIGETWDAPAELILDHLSQPYVIRLKVRYVLQEVKEIRGIETAVITYAFEKEDDLSKQNYPPDFPLKIGTTDTGIIYWDIKANRPFDGSDTYKIIFLNPDNTVIQFTMNIQTDYKVYESVSKTDADKAKEEIKKDLADKEGVTVESDDRGLVLRLGEVLFDFDSANLRKDTRNTLDAVITAVKKQYPDREVLVEGYTDNTGVPKYNMNLSSRRASTVAGYLQKGIGHDKFSYRGYGAENPIAENSTKEGRAKNRRVEIIIKLK
jgi:outer membrane protein OmpA-like peptidoglycan-associated protein